MNNRLCIASTYFDYPNENDNYGIAVKKKTMRVNDHVLTEKYVKQYK